MYYTCFEDTCYFYSNFLLNAKVARSLKSAYEFSQEHKQTKRLMGGIQIGGCRTVVFYQQRNRSVWSNLLNWSEPLKKNNDFYDMTFGVLLWLTCGLSLMLVLFFAPRVFLWVFQFPSLLKNKHSKFQWRQWKQEPPRGMSTAKIPLFIIVIILSLLLLLLFVLVLVLTKRFAKCYLSLRHLLPKQETLFLLSFSSHFVKYFWWEKTLL